MRINTTKLAPASTTHMFILVFNSAALIFAAAIAVSACKNVIFIYFETEENTFLKI